MSIEHPPAKMRDSGHPRMALWLLVLGAVLLGGVTVSAYLVFVVWLGDAWLDDQPPKPTAAASVAAPPQ